jgi:hypothetical protein
MDAKGQDIERAYRIARATRPAPSAAVDPAMSAPLPAYGTRLRGIRFVDGDRAHRLVGELIDNLAGTGGAHLLSLHAPTALRGVIERLAHRARRMRERLRYLPRRLVAQIADTSLRLIQHPVFATSQPFVAARAFGLARLRVLDSGKLLVALLDGRLGGASTDEDGLLAVGGGDQGIHAQVHSDHARLGSFVVQRFADEAHDPIGEPHFHEPAWHVRQSNMRRSALSVRQDKPSVANTRILVARDDIVIATQPPGVTRLGVASRTQLPSRLDGVAKLADKLLCGLRGQAGVAPYGRDGPALPARLAWPRPTQSANAVMAHDQIIPKARRLLAAGTKESPRGDRMWLPRDFYRALTHREDTARMFEKSKVRGHSPPCLKALALWPLFGRIDCASSAGARA